MKTIFLTVFSVFFCFSVYAQSDKSYFFIEEENFNSDLPFPGEVSGHNFGEWHFSHENIIEYLKALTEKSDRLTMIEYGRTHENRPLYLLMATSAGNQNDLETIRKNHLQNIFSPEEPADDSPLVLWMGYSVHGNETSPAHASMLTAYYLAASQSEKVKNILDSTVVLIDPCLNPDGFNRATTWSNMNSHKTDVTHPSNRQFNEDWPGGRTNHYWFDLNRDWLPAQHPESQSRLDMFHKWKPHVTTDHHEMGSSSTFFFQPGVPERVNPLTPDKNQVLTKEISKFHAKALDNIGTLYFSEEGFDDYYYGKGSTYPDVNASIGILFEQARVLGKAVETSHGMLTFAEAIRNQFTVSVSTLEGSFEKRKELQQFQKDFYRNAKREAEEEDVKAYVFGDEKDPVKLSHFLELLDNHDINVYNLNQKLETEGKSFKPESAYIVPVKQNQYRIINSMFEQQTEYEDSIFYDISTWTMPLAFDLDYAELTGKSFDKRYLGDLLDDPEYPKGEVKGGQSSVGYVADGSGYNIHAFLYQLLDNDIIAKVAENSFKTMVDSEEYEFNNGSIFIPAAKQDMSDDELYQTLSEEAEQYGVELLSLQTGLSVDGVDMGSWRMSPVEKPEILLITGSGISSYSTGEIWHLLDNRMDIPVVMAKNDRISGVNLDDFNTIVLPSGSYNWSENMKERFKRWVRKGGVVISISRANRMLEDMDLVDWEEKNEEEDTTEEFLSYDSRSQRRRSESVSGVILNSSIDPTHPVCYGMSASSMPVFKNNNYFIEISEDPYATPIRIGEEPLLSGYLSSKNLKRIENTAWCLVKNPGRGTIISFVDSPNFRGFWYGTNKVFLNSIFFGQHVN
ncbi:MAG: M14 family zinc carboxypeptidase [Bacteroidota bacterium]